MNLRKDCAEPWFYQYISEEEAIPCCRRPGNITCRIYNLARLCTVMTFHGN